MGIDIKVKVRAALAGADQSFADTGDVMEALGWVALAAKVGEPIPPRIGAWLHKSIKEYERGTVTMDAALGLNATGRANPRGAKTHEALLQGALARMMILHVLGATIPQAAALVATLAPTPTRATLADRYRRRGLGKMVLANRKQVLAHYRRSDIEKILAEYPDHRGEPAEAKACIRTMYAKHRP